MNRSSYKNAERDRMKGIYLFSLNFYTIFLDPKVTINCEKASQMSLALRIPIKKQAHDADWKAVVLATAPTTSISLNPRQSWLGLQSRNTSNAPFTCMPRSMTRHSDYAMWATLFSHVPLQWVISQRCDCCAYNHWYVGYKQLHFCRASTLKGLWVTKLEKTGAREK